MGATRKPRTPTPSTSGEVEQNPPVVNIDAGQESPAEPPVVTPDGAQDVTGDNRSGTSPAPSTSAQDAPDGEGNEPEDGGSPKYPAEHFFKCNWYSHRRGELERLLEEDKAYSYAQVERMLSRQ